MMCQGARLLRKASLGSALDLLLSQIPCMGDNHPCNAERISQYPTAVPPEHVINWHGDSCAGGLGVRTRSPLPARSTEVSPFARGYGGQGSRSSG